MLLSLQSFHLTAQTEMTEAECHASIEQVEEVALFLLVVDEHHFLLSTEVSHTKHQLRVVIELFAEQYYSRIGYFPISQ